MLLIFVIININFLVSFIKAENTTNIDQWDEEYSSDEFDLDLSNLVDGLKKQRLLDAFKNKKSLIVNQVRGLNFDVKPTTILDNNPNNASNFSLLKSIKTESNKNNIPNIDDDVFDDYSEDDDSNTVKYELPQSDKDKNNNTQKSNDTTKVDTKLYPKSLFPSSKNFNEWDDGDYSSSEQDLNLQKLIDELETPNILEKLKRVPSVIPNQTNQLNLDVKSRKPGGFTLLEIIKNKTINVEVDDQDYDSKNDFPDETNTEENYSFGEEYSDEFDDNSISYDYPETGKDTNRLNLTISQNSTKCGNNTTKVNKKKESKSSFFEIETVDSKILDYDNYEEMFDSKSNENCTKSPSKNDSKNSTRSFEDSYEDYNNSNLSEYDDDDNKKSGNKPLVEERNFNLNITEYDDFSNEVINSTLLENNSNKITFISLIKKFYELYFKDFGIKEADLKMIIKTILDDNFDDNQILTQLDLEKITNKFNNFNKEQFGLKSILRKLRDLKIDVNRNLLKLVMKKLLENYKTVISIPKINKIVGNFDQNEAESKLSNILKKFHDYYNKHEKVIIDDPKLFDTSMKGILFNLDDAMARIFDLYNNPSSYIEKDRLLVDIQLKQTLRKFRDVHKNYVLNMKKEKSFDDTITTSVIDFFKTLKQYYLFFNKDELNVDYDDQTSAKNENVFWINSVELNPRFENLKQKLSSKEDMLGDIKEKPKQQDVSPLSRKINTGFSVDINNNQVLFGDMDIIDASNNSFDSNISVESGITMNNNNKTKTKITDNIELNSKNDVQKVINLDSTNKGIINTIKTNLPGSFISFGIIKTNSTSNINGIKLELAPNSLQENNSQKNTFISLIKKFYELYIKDFGLKEEDLKTTIKTILDINFDDNQILTELDLESLTSKFYNLGLSFDKENFSLKPILNKLSDLKIDINENLLKLVIKKLLENYKTVIFIPKINRSDFDKKEAESKLRNILKKFHVYYNTYEKVVKDDPKLFDTSMKGMLSDLDDSMVRVFDLYNNKTAYNEKEIMLLDIQLKKALRNLRDVLKNYVVTMKNEKIFDDNITTSVNDFIKTLKQYYLFFNKIELNFDDDNQAFITNENLKQILPNNEGILGDIKEKSKRKDLVSPLTRKINTGFSFYVNNNQVSSEDLDVIDETYNSLGSENSIESAIMSNNKTTNNIESASKTNVEKVINLNTANQGIIDTTKINSPGSVISLGINTTNSTGNIVASNIIRVINSTVNSTSNMTIKDDKPIIPNTNTQLNLNATTVTNTTIKDDKTIIPNLNFQANSKTSEVANMTNKDNKTSIPNTMNVQSNSKTGVVTNTTIKDDKTIIPNINTQLNLNTSTVTNTTIKDDKTIIPNINDQSNSKTSMVINTTNKDDKTITPNTMNVQFNSKTNVVTNTTIKDVKTIISNTNDQPNLKNNTITNSTLTTINIRNDTKDNKVISSSNVKVHPVTKETSVIISAIQNMNAPNLSNFLKNSEIATYRTRDINEKLNSLNTAESKSMIDEITEILRFPGKLKGTLREKNKTVSLLTKVRTRLRSYLKTIKRRSDF